MRAFVIPAACLALLLATRLTLHAEGVSVTTGSVVIEAHDPEVLIIVGGDGQVEITDVQTGRTLRLDPKTLELVLGKGENQIDIPADQFTLKRRSRPIATIRRATAPNRAAIPNPSQVRPTPPAGSPQPAGQPAGQPGQPTQANHTAAPWRVLTGHAGRVSAVQFSPDGKTAASASWDGTVRLWDVVAGRPLWVCERGERPPQLSSVAFSPDGRYVYAGAGDGRVCIVDTRTGREVRQINPEYGGIHALAVLPDGQRMLVSATTNSTGRDGLTWLADLTNGKTIRKFQQPMDQIYDLRVSRDGRLGICAGGYSQQHDTELNGMVRVWDLQSGEVLFNYQPKLRSGVAEAALSPDGTQVLSPQAHGLYPGEEKKLTPRPKWLALWDVKSGRKLREFPQYQRVGAVAFSPDGRRAICCTSDEGIDVFSVDSGELVHSFGGGIERSRGIGSLDVSPDGRLFITGHGDSTVRLWRLPGPADPTDPPPQKAPQAASRPTLQPDAWTAQPRQKISRDRTVYALAISPDGRKVLSSEHTTLRLWDPLSGRDLKSSDDAPPVRDIAWSLDGRYALMGTTDSQRLVLWDVQEWQPVRHFEGHTQSPQCVAFSRDGRRALSASMNGEVFAWDVASGRQISRYQPPHKQTVCLTFSPDGRYGLLASRHQRVLDGQGPKDDRLRLFEIETGREVRVFDGPESFVAGAGFSEDGRRVVSVNYKGSVNVWDIASGKSVREFQVPADWYGPSIARVSDDGRLVLIGSGLGAARLWDVETGRRLADLTPTLEAEVEADRLRHRGIEALDIAPKTGLAVFSRADTSVQVWSFRDPTPANGKAD